MAHIWDLRENSLNVLILLNFFVQDFEKDVYIRKKFSLYYQCDITNDVYIYVCVYVYFRYPPLYSGSSTVFTRYSFKTDSSLRTLGVWKHAIFGLEFRHLL